MVFNEYESYRVLESIRPCFYQISGMEYNDNGWEVASTDLLQHQILSYEGKTQIDGSEYYIFYSSMGRERFYYFALNESQVHRLVEG